MKESDGLKFQLLQEKDIEILTPIMERAFDEDARIHLNEVKGGPPGYNNGDFLRKYGLSKDATSYKISLDGEAIGCLILWINEKIRINFLGNIFIDVSLQNKGLGKRVWRFIEQEYPNTMLSFEKAIEIGVNGIEFDVHKSKDNKLVIIHDEDIERTNIDGMFTDYPKLLLEVIKLGDS